MRYVCIVLLLLLLVGVVPAQDPRGSIVGRVTDQSGAALADLVVQATNMATNVAATARTSSAGTFTIPYLLPGYYAITVEVPGFKKFVRENIEVRVTESVEIPVVLEVGAVTDTITVVAETPLLPTTDANQGTVIEDRALNDLPLMGGNPIEFALLDPAVMNETDMRERRAPITGAASQWSSMGTAQYRNEFQIDGVSNTYAEADKGRARVAFNPPASAIGQFRLLTNPFDAAAGNALGAVVNVSTKSGTNEFHGGGHYHHRNAALDTMDFFYNKNNTRKPVYNDHRFGLHLGGPIHIPKVYNGRNRSFFFYAWDMSLWGDPNRQSFSSTVPSAAQREGDFSGLLNLGSSYQIYNPFTTRRNPAGSGYVRDPFPGNIIPKSLFNPAGSALANLYPLPNQPGNPDGTSNYFRATTASERYWVHLVRFDHAFSDSHRAFLRLHYDFWEEDKNRWYETPIQGIVLNRINRGLALDDVVLLTPNLVLNLRYGITQQDFTEERVSRGIDLAAMGFSPELTKLIRPGSATLPKVSVGAYTGFSFWESGDGATNSLTHNINATLSTQRGIHAFKWGVDFRTYRSFGDRYPLAAAPEFLFSNAYTRGPLNSSPGSSIGQEMASMLVGIAASGQMEDKASFALQTLYLGGFIQDDMKLTHSLTLNLGLRYELEWPMTERFDRMITGFSFDQPNPIEEAARAAYASSPILEIPVENFRVRGGMLFAGQTPSGRSLFTMDKNNFMPRIGLAWQVSPWMAVRAGYGIFYGNLGVNTSIPRQYGFSQSTPLLPTTDDGQTYSALVSNPFPDGLLPADGASGGMLTQLGQGLVIDNPWKKHAYSQRWTLALNTVLPGQTAVEAAYVGTRGTHLEMTRDINAVPNVYLSTKPVRDDERVKYLAQSSPNPLFGLGPTFTAKYMSRYNLLKPYPHFTTLTMTDSDGYAWYHGLQVRASRRWSKGLTFNVGYAFSKTMDAIRFLNVADPMPYESLSPSHRPHRLTISGVWQLPVGRGRAVGRNLPRVLQGILGNWQLSGVVVRQAGGPLPWSNIIFTGDPDDIKLPKSQRTVDRWFNTEAGFNKSSQEVLTYNVRQFPMYLASIQADGQARWDASLSKTFKIAERGRFQLRLQCFNLWNHANFGRPQMTPTNKQFGQITTTQGPPRSFQVSARFDF